MAFEDELEQIRRRAGITEASRKRRRYTGNPPETGGTSQNLPVSPALVDLVNKGAFQGAKKIVDFGAGEWGRNANWLREQGYKVWAFDPYNGQPGADGWTAVSTKLPRGKFDIGFTFFVLNVVPEHVEREIIADLAKITPVRYHITRNMDIFTLAKNSLGRGVPLVVDWFNKEFATPKERKMLQAGTLDDQTIMEFCEFGFITKVRKGTGFQRIPTSEDLGLNLIRKTGGFKVYKG